MMVCCFPKLRVRVAYGMVVYARGLSLLIWSFLGGQAFGWTTEVGSNAGLMQQPASQYYHLVYGAVVGAANDSRKFQVRGAYIERPKFSANNYVDQDYGWFGSVGSQLVGNEKHGLRSFVGYGSMGGYIKAVQDGETVERRSYRLYGAAFQLEYAARWRSIWIAASHETFIGMGDRNQTEAYVAWPFNFALVSLGFTL